MIDAEAMQLHERVRRLEGMVRSLAAIAAAGSVLLLAAMRPSNRVKPQETLRVHRIELIDTAGVVRGLLRVNDTGRGVLTLSGPTSSEITLSPSMIHVADRLESASIQAGRIEVYQEATGAAILSSGDGGPLLTFYSASLEPELFAGHIPMSDGTISGAVFAVIRDKELLWMSPGR